MAAHLCGSSPIWSSWWVWKVEQAQQCLLRQDSSTYIICVPSCTFLICIRGRCEGRTCITVFSVLGRLLRGCGGGCCTRPNPPYTSLRFKSSSSCIYICRASSLVSIQNSMKIDAGRALSGTLAGISTSIAGTAEVWTVFRHFHVYSPAFIYY